MAALLVLGAAGMGAVRYMYTRENKRRKRTTLGWGEAEFATERSSTIRRGDQKLDFEYTL